MNQSNSLTVPIEYEKEVDALLSSKGIEVKNKSLTANSALWPNSDTSEDTKTNRFVTYGLTISATIGFWLHCEIAEARNRKLLPSPK